MAKRQAKADADTVRPGPTPKPKALRSLNAEELALRSRHGCQASFAELVQRYGMPLFDFLRYKTNSLQDAEDLVQDTFVKAYENIHRYNNSWKFSTWLFTIAARLASSHFRRLRPRRTLEDIESDGIGPGQRMIKQEMRKNLWAMAADLSKNQYQALWLKYAQDMSIKDIAKVMRKSQVNVKVILYRARINLAKRLQEVTVEEEATDQTSSKEIVSFMKVEGA
jgi:RNA polymerase sigma-70 factor (ECF subfamily)